MAIDPAALRQVAAWLTPGKVVLLDFPDAKKKKFFVVGQVYPDLLLIVINSVPLKHPKLCAECQVGMAGGEGSAYPFFSHIESYANCYQIVDSILRETAMRQLAANPRWMKGEINPETRTKIVEAIKKSDVIEPIRLKALLKALS